ncbi:MAG TPA: hypothetical protein VKC57_10015 [Ktedonobacterales bacterium]|nr:hypothetical protein [Ktedonobacterales bacterium]
MVPSTIEQFDAPPEGWLHVPYSCPLAFVQTPPQQSVPEPHASPVCPQNEDAPHTPFVQSVEQH